MPVDVANRAEVHGASVERMKSRGYRATPQRLAVMEALASETPPRLREVRKRCPEVGAARRVDFGRGSEGRCRLIRHPRGAVFDLEEEASMLERTVTSSMSPPAELGRIKVHARHRAWCATCS